MLYDFKTHDRNMDLDLVIAVSKDGDRDAASSKTITLSILKPSRLWRIFTRKQCWLLIGIGLLLLFYAKTEIGNIENSQKYVRVIHQSHLPGMEGYLVWNENCKMPNLDPYDPETMKFFKRKKFTPCSKLPPLTSVSYNESNQRYMLYMHKNRLKAYSRYIGVNGFSCCYKTVTRPTAGEKIDFRANFSYCVGFSKNTMLAHSIDSIIVGCYNGKQLKRKNSDRPFYANGHAMMPERQKLQERFNTWQRTTGEQQQRPINVLMIGIDTISRINLIRAMPTTAQYLYDNEWFEMAGYNKIDDNTFPNLMAVLTGRNHTTIDRECSPKKYGGLDNCTFVWDLFQKFGYVTAFGEDDVTINTFNYYKKGFIRQPVDYYMRPYLIAAEGRLRSKTAENQMYCVGPQHSVEAVYDYALELVQRYRSEPFFGLFWTNTLSHDDISDSTALDAKMVDYLQRFTKSGALDSTIIIFFSDHGTRFGPTRTLETSQYEERLPFLFLWLPAYLRQLHPEFVQALNANKNRLTNPFDLHVTLKHVLALSGRVSAEEQSVLLQPIKDCPRCQSLLQPVAANRSCDDIAIEDHWCTCIPYEYVNRSSQLIYKVTLLTVNYINEFVSTYENGLFANLCVPLYLETIEQAHRAQLANNASATTYRIRFITRPNKGLYEATVRFNAETEELIVTGEISRLNAYGKEASCATEGAAIKYCSCKTY